MTCWRCDHDRPECGHERTPTTSMTLTCSLPEDHVGPHETCSVTAHPLARWGDQQTLEAFADDGS